MTQVSYSWHPLHIPSSRNPGFLKSGLCCWSSETVNPWCGQSQFRRPLGGSLHFYHCKWFLKASLTAQILLSAQELCLVHHKIDSKQLKESSEMVRAVVGDEVQVEAQVDSIFASRKPVQVQSLVVVIALIFSCTLILLRFPSSVWEQKSSIIGDELLWWSSYGDFLVVDGIESPKWNLTLCGLCCFGNRIARPYWVM